MQRLVEARGIDLVRHGADLVGRCPFHDDRTPSLVVSPSKNLWHCFGACGTGGSVIDWVMRTEGVSFRHAVELLRAGATDTPATSSGRPPRHGSVRHLTTPVDADGSDAEVLGRVADFYAAALVESPDGLAYLARRRIADPEAVVRFRLGVSDRSLGYRLPEKNRKAGAAIRGRLGEVGILRASGHEHFSGSLVIPIVDEAGAVVGMYGRKLLDTLRAGTPKHLYLPGPHRGVFNAGGLAGGEVIVCESLIDALTFWCAGIRNVTCAYGTEGFTDDHRVAFTRLGVNRVLIAYDRDQAGDRAATTLASELLAGGVECFRVLFPQGADVNSYVCESDSPATALARVIRAAEWLGAGTPPVGPSPTPNTDLTASDIAGQPCDGHDLEVGDGTDGGSSFAAGSSPLPTGPGPDVTPTPNPDPDPSGLPAGPAGGLVVSPVPADVTGQVGELVGDEWRMVVAGRRWRVRGLAKVTGFDALRVNVMVSHTTNDGPVFHIDTLDLYSARARGVFTTAAAAELAVDAAIIHSDLSRVLLGCETAVDAVIAAAQTPADPGVVLSAVEEAAALGLLRDPNLVERIVADFGRVGMVGEATNALVGYLAAISRKLDAPLAVIVQSTSAAGKSSLMDAVLGFVPEEDRVQFSAMTGQSLFYMGETGCALLIWPHLVG